MLQLGRVRAAVEATAESEYLPVASTDGQTDLTRCQIHDMASGGRSSSVVQKPVETKFTWHPAKHHQAVGPNNLDRRPLC